MKTRLEPLIQHQLHILSLAVINPLTPGSEV